MQMKSLNSIMSLLISGYLSLNVSSTQAAIGVNEINLSSGTKLTMPNNLKPGCYGKNRTEEDCSPTTPLNLIYKGKTYSYNKLIEPWEGSFFIYFVKLGPNSYARDLNGDGFKEIAIYPAVCGNSPKSLAYIYTVKGHTLLPYGTGIYFWEAEIPVKNIKRDPNFKPDI
jgi:hypothetical protein